MKLCTIFTVMLAFVVSMIVALPTDHTAADVTPINNLFERAAELFCDDKAYWLGTVNCANIWAGIYYLEDNVGDRTLTCSGYQRCRWSCSYNTGLYVDNTGPNAFSTTGKGFAQEIRSIIQDCRGGTTCNEHNRNEYWFRGEKNYGRNERKIMISHTSPFNERC